MTFPYTEFLGLAEERVFRPMIPVTFKNGKHEFKTYSLIDSGADYSILPLETAGNLGIKLSPELSYNILGAGGNIFKIYKSPDSIEYIMQNRGFRDIQWESPIYFAESGNAFLLGQKGFLEKFKITLNGKNKMIEINV